MSEPRRKLVNKNIGEQGRCPCGGDAVIRVNRHTNKRFVGCSDFPVCRWTEPLEETEHVEERVKGSPANHGPNDNDFCGQEMHDEDY